MSARFPLPASLVAVLGTTLLLLAVIAVNGWPSVFTDTDDYYSLGQEIADRIAIPLTGHYADAEWRPAARDAAADAHMARSQMAARSVGYALLVYPLHHIGTLWLLAAVQSALVGWVLWLVWRVTVPDLGVAPFLGAVAVLAGLTSLPFFAGFAMPDIFAGLAILAAILLLTAADRLSRATRTGLTVLLLYCFIVHTSHVLVGAILLVPAWPLLRWQGVARGPAAARMAVVGGALIAGTLVNTAYGAWTLVDTGEPLRRPPFLIARVLADGPGRAYLRSVCAHGHPYALCRFQHAPLDNSDEILWEDPPKGIFNISPYKVRMALEDEEPRFVLGTLRYDLGGEVRAALANWWQQAKRIEVDDPVRDPVYYLTDTYWKDTHLPELLNALNDCDPDSRGCAPKLTPRLSRRLHAPVVGVAGLAVLGGLTAAFARQRRGVASDDRRLAVIATLTTAGVILNAAVCGILSGPFARYQARLIWLLPFVALLFAADWWQRRSRATNSVSAASGNFVAIAGTL